MQRLPGRRRDVSDEHPDTSKVAGRIATEAAESGQSPEGFLSDAVAETLTQGRAARQAHLECRLVDLMRDFIPDEIAATAARRITT